MTTSGPRHLLLSIHDVGPRFETDVDRLRDLLGRHAPADRIALLVVPNHWGDAPIRAGSPFARRLFGWAEAGADIFLHGWYHRDQHSHASAAARFKARHMTAGEGEFLGLDQAEAALRMERGRALLEDIIGRPLAGFIAPAWLYGPGAIAALGESEFALAEDHWNVWNPSNGAILCSGPVLTWASRSRARILGSLAVAAALPWLMRRSAYARVGVHPGDVAVPVLVASIDTALSRFTKTHSPLRYSDLPNFGVA